MDIKTFTLLHNKVLANISYEKELFLNKEWQNNKGEQPYIHSWLDIDNNRKNIENVLIEVMFQNGQTHIDTPWGFYWKKEPQIQLTDFIIEQWRVHSFDLAEPETEEEQAATFAEWDIIFEEQLENDSILKAMFNKNVK